MNLKEVYSKLITESSRATYNYKLVDNPTFVKEGVNASCGDDIVINAYVKNNIIEDAGYSGDGCAISKASTNIMIDIIKGKTVEEAKELVDLFLKMIRGEELTQEERDKLEESIALEGISKLPTRTKCATLPWHTLDDGLEFLKNKK